MPAELYNLGGKSVFIAGHRGMVGSAIVRRLASESCTILTATRSELDLTRQFDVEQWFAKHRPQAVFLAAAKVGGIHANDKYPADFLYENLMIEANIIKAAANNGVEKLLFLGSSCIYPKHATQPIKESELLEGALEPTNEWYAIAKIAGIKLCQSFRRQHGFDFISAMPTNLYGRGDNYHPENSHVMPALIRKISEAQASGAPSITLWGTGTPRREFLHADDCADALVFLMKHYSDYEHVNVGSGTDIAIKDLARLIAQTASYDGAIKHDLTKPDGTMRKLMDNAKLQAMGWQPTISLEAGIKTIYSEFQEQHS